MSNNILQALLQSKVDHMTDPSDDCNVAINYTLQQVLLVLIQKITGDQTHVIFSNISSEIDKMCKEFSMDLKKKTSTLKWKVRPSSAYWYKTSNKIRKKLVTYPGTSIKFYVTLKIDYHDAVHRWDSGKWINNKWIDKSKLTDNTNYVEISMYVPQKRIIFSDASMQEVLAEGDLLDMSEDIEEPVLKTDSKKQKKGGSDDE